MPPEAKFPSDCGNTDHSLIWVRSVLESSIANTVEISRSKTKNLSSLYRIIALFKTPCVAPKGQRDANDPRAKTENSFAKHGLLRWYHQTGGVCAATALRELLFKALFMLLGNS